MLLWLVILVSAFASGNGARGAVGGAFIAVACFAVVTGLYVLLTGRGSWAHLRNRIGGVIAVAVGVALFVSSAAVIPSGPDTAPAKATTATGQSQAGQSQADKTKPTSTPSTHAKSSTPKTKNSHAATPKPSHTAQHKRKAAKVVHKTKSKTTKNGVRALALLATLPIKGRAPKTGYERSKFGPTWEDEDSNGCDTRNDILKRDLTRVTYTYGDCKVASGVLHDPYTGKTIHFVQGLGTSRTVQIDHVVALMDAWQKGAQQLTTATRTELANDPLELLAVDGQSNEQKQAGDAATWLPPNKAYRCTYVGKQIQVKAKYHLWVTQAEHDAMTRVLSSCKSLSMAVVVPVPVHKATPEHVHHSKHHATPKPPANPKPPAKPKTRAPLVVHPGAYCAPTGAHGVTDRGTPMTCKPSATDSRARWRSTF